MTNKIDLKKRITDFYNLNKKKLYFSVLIILIIFISIVFYNYNNEQKNISTAEKYIQAGIYLSSKRTIMQKNYMKKLF